MNDEGAVLDWVRFYGLFVVVLIVLGCAGGLAYNRLTSGGFEATSIVLETSGRISPNRLGPVAEAVFRTEEVYGPAMRELGLDQSPEQFLNETVDLRPVPDASALIVVGRADSLEDAKSISNATARSLETAFAERVELTNFVVFGTPEAASLPEGVAPAVGVVLGGAMGFWLALSAAVIHYWRVRPVLRLERALGITGADLVLVLDGWGRWLGLLRGRPRVKNSPSNRRRYEHAGASGPTARVPRLESLRRAAADPAPAEDRDPDRARSAEAALAADDETTIVSYPGVSERYLVEASRFASSLAGGSRGRPSLVWVH
ncbi:MAG: hypothetical protein ACRDJV_02975 [Actinomycetota bacterium]